jgi:hypothetical protein
MLSLDRQLAALFFYKRLVPRVKAQDFKKDFAAKRSNQDAQAANDHTKLVDQWVVGLNGAAATAILTFTSANYLILARGSLTLAAGLFFFALGALFGALAMRAHSRALYEWLYVWQLAAGVRNPTDAPDSDTPEKSYKDALTEAARHDWFFRCSIVCFLLGCSAFGITMVTVFYQRAIWPFLML